MLGHAAQSDHITKRAPDAPRPLSFPQERLFVLDRIMPGLPAYNVPTLVRVATTLDDELLARALNTVVARHEILRTSIALVDGEPVQAVRPGDEVDLAVWDLRGAPEADRAVRAQELLGAVVRTPFDLSADVLLRAALVHMSPGEDLLLVVFHHIASDHVSGSILFKELDELFAAQTDGREPDLPALPIQYADYAAAQREQLAGTLQDELLEYWTAKLAGAPERLELPTDRPRPNVQSYRGALREFTLEPAVAQPLRELARREGVSPFMLLLAAFNTLLHRYSGAEDIVVGVPVSGRHREEIAPLLGYFSNTLALRTDLSGDPRFSELLAQVKLNTLEAQIYQELPFERLVEVLNPERAQSHSPLFQVLFGYDVAPAQPLRLAGHDLEPLPVPGWEWSRFDLSIVVREVPDGSLHAQLEYATDLFDSTTIERLIGHFATLAGRGRPCPAEPLVRAAVADGRRAGGAGAPKRHRPVLRQALPARAVRRPGSPDARTRSPSRPARNGSPSPSSSAPATSSLASSSSEDWGQGSWPGSASSAPSPSLWRCWPSSRRARPTSRSSPPTRPQRQEFMLADAGAVVLITQERFLGVIERTARRRCASTAKPTAVRSPSQSAQPLAGTSDPEQRAYVIYTSGSTGQPKGVEIRHRLGGQPDRPHARAPRNRPRRRAGQPDHPGVRPLGSRLVSPAHHRGAARDRPARSHARRGRPRRLARAHRRHVRAGDADDLAAARRRGLEGKPGTQDRLRRRGAPARPGPAAAGPRSVAVAHVRSHRDHRVVLHRSRSTHESGPVPIGGPIANTTFYVLDPDRRAGADRRPRRAVHRRRRPGARLPPPCRS